MTIKDNVARRTVSTLLLFLLAAGTASSQGFQSSDTNYSNCVAGLSFGCRPDLLTDAQRAKVHQAERARNYSNCVAGLSFGCRPDLLTDAQRAKVHQAERARNYSNCVAGLSFGCRPDLLTDAQRRGVKSKWESQAQDAIRPITAPCAENGSCYGDISVATDRPKTVHVKGYYRRDGTYVRGHYRSKPRR